MQKDWRHSLKVLIQSRPDIKVTTPSTSLGFSADYISRILNNPKSNPQMNNIQKICDALDVSFADVMAGQALDVMRQEAIETVSAMGSRDLKNLLDHLNNNVDLTDQK